VPAVPAQRHRRWEYRVVPFPTDDGPHGLINLNTAGDEGWEAVGVIPKDLNESWVMLKRELLQDDEPRGPVGFGR
jgi:hypothetical protein